MPNILISLKVVGSSNAEDNFKKLGIISFTTESLILAQDER